MRNDSKESEIANSRGKKKDWTGKMITYKIVHGTIFILSQPEVDQPPGGHPGVIGALVCGGRGSTKTSQDPLCHHLHVKANVRD